MSYFSIKGNYVDILNNKIFAAAIDVQNGKIVSIEAIAAGNKPLHYILPGFIDSHVHIESSMLVPSEFAKLAVVHGTVATISDPHEIANVCGMQGVQYMIENGKTVPFKFHFGAPSCVPATIFETAGATLDAEAVATLLQSSDIYYLSEMMNFPGVLHRDQEVMKKIAAAHHAGKPVDGHAPGLMGNQAAQYAAAGISTDHECFTKEEAEDKLKAGMKILIREGSAAKNFEALIELLHHFPNEIMFCSDDKHPDSLAAGHINELCARAVAKGIDVFKVLRAACINPVLHYKMNVGLLQKGDDADFIVVKDLTHFDVVQTYINGKLVAENGKSKVETMSARIINHFSCMPKQEHDFAIKADSTKPSYAIEALDGQLITNKISINPKEENGFYISDPENDFLKIAVVNRYQDGPVALSFIRNIGLKNGAIASSVAHDSHNIVVTGTDDESICKAVNLIVAHKGGISLVTENREMIIPLPVAGLMSNENGYKIAEQYALIDKAAKEAGSALSSPFMTLSFMALLVIPHLKLSDKGLFDGDSFQFIV